jgi:hypothetical protein
MRYFKCKNTGKNEKNAWKEHYKILLEDEKRTVRKEKAWRIFSTIDSYVVLFSFVKAVIYLLQSIPQLLQSIPQPSRSFLRIGIKIVILIIGVILFAIGGALTWLLTRPLWKKVESFNLPLMKKEVFSKACGFLRDYYGLKEPYIITKCFDSTNENFNNHDVCIFVSNDELRITGDLIHGFFHGERDLGCYAFKRDEITLSKQQNENRLIAELKSDNTVFLLGYRAKGFIEKNFIDSESMQ